MSAGTRQCPSNRRTAAPQGRRRPMREGVPSGPGSFRELQNWQQPPPKQTQTMGRESSSQTLGPARVSHSCMSQTQINLLRGIPPHPGAPAVPRGTEVGQCCSVDEVEGQLYQMPTEQYSVCEAPYILHVPVHNPLP